MSHPLSGIRVVEFSHMVVGPSRGLVLGDLGADVVKIEPAPEGGNTRRLVGAGAGLAGDAVYNEAKLRAEKATASPTILRSQRPRFEPSSSLQPKNPPLSSLPTIQTALLDWPPAN
jgi:hypothetical protein